jgi:hypothetical protein
MAEEKIRWNHHISKGKHIFTELNTRVATVESS